MLHIKRAAFHVAGSVLFPFAQGYMNAKYLKKLHISRFRNQITLVYARADATPIVISVDEVVSMDVQALGAWFHAQVADLNPDQPIPQLKKFRFAAKQAHELAHSRTQETAASVPRVGIIAEAI